MLFNVETGLVFWDEVDNTSICLFSSVDEKHLPMLDLSQSFIDTYKRIILQRQETTQIQLEELIEILKNLYCTDENPVYDTTNGYKIVEITIDSISNRQGLLAPYAVGE